MTNYSKNQSIQIIRNGQLHGPYSLDTLKHYVQQGLILKQDSVVSKNGESLSVRDILKDNDIKTRAINDKNILKQIQSFGAQLLLPKKAISFRTLKADKTLLMVSAIGLAPAFLITFTGSSLVTFYAIALYFSMIWGLFYLSVFSTPQVSIKKAFLLFFLTQLFIIFLVEIIQVPNLHPLYQLIENDSNLINRLIGYIFGVGLFEEFVKLFPVYLILRKSKEPLKPQTVVFYGLISGIGFGVFEGVIYQIGFNSKLDYQESFFMNVARLTSLPFLHSVWSGISSYFLAFSFLYPKNRQAMWLLAVVIPSLIHGLYNTLGWSISGLFISYLGVTLLVIYLKNAKDFQQRILK